MSSVYVRKRRESRYEPIIYAETLRDELIEFAKREYGIRDSKTLVRKKYVVRKIVMITISILPCYMNIVVKLINVLFC